MAKRAEEKDKLWRFMGQDCGNIILELKIGPKRTLEGEFYLWILQLNKCYVSTI
jgi:hypothetical protein